MGVDGAFVGAMACCLLGCNLVVSLDDLQDGAGAAGSTGALPVGPGPSTGPSSPTSSGTGSPTSSTGTGDGGGGSAPTYDACVTALGPVARFRLDDASTADEPNLGSWGGVAVASGTRMGEAPLVDGSLSATSFAPDGALTLATPAFFGSQGGYQPFSIELWFRAPSSFSEEVVSVQMGMALLYLRIQERMDPMGLDSIQFRALDPSHDRGVIENLDLADGAPHHLVAVYRQTAATVFTSGSADDLVIYVDGVPTANLATGIEAPIPAMDGPLVIGGGFGGPLDELAIYPVELPPATVAALTALGNGQLVDCPAL
ncbi:MAG: hypothetical protein JNL21_05435 [Myxococcales bacterium]|nr:hypothetical protein [Myxococcales bacterium]